MNTETPDPCIEDPAPAPEPSTLARPARSNHKPSSGSRSRRNGNIARLPKAIRDKINLMLQDGVTYSSIIEQLGQDGEGLGISNLSRWKDGGHQDWLLEQSFIGQVRDRLESASDLTRDFDASQVNHAALQLGTLQIFDAFRDLATEPDRHHSSPSNARPDASLSSGRGEGEEDQKQRSPSALDRKLGGNSAAFARLMNALARASRETLQLQNYREACAKARAAIKTLRDPKRKLSEDERRSLVLMVDDILGLPSQDDPSSTAGTEPTAPGDAPVA